ncbi:MAG: hypothetical protein ABL893_15995, partial [Hyphomicrobium sp.]
YGNRAALQAIATELQRISASDPSENFEIHLRLGLSDHEALFGNCIRKNIWVVEEGDQCNVSQGNDVPNDAIPSGFEVTFMHVTESQLDSLEPSPQCSCSP